VRESHVSGSRFDLLVHGLARRKDQPDHSTVPHSSSFVVTKPSSRQRRPGTQQTPIRTDRMCFKSHRPFIQFFVNPDYRDQVFAFFSTTLSAWSTHFSESLTPLSCA
jgi:hypothetical protein